MAAARTMAAAASIGGGDVLLEPGALSRANAKLHARLQIDLVASRGSDDPTAGDRANHRAHGCPAAADDGADDRAGGGAAADDGGVTAARAFALDLALVARL